MTKTAGTRFTSRLSVRRGRLASRAVAGVDVRVAPPALHEPMSAQEAFSPEPGLLQHARRGGIGRLADRPHAPRTEARERELHERPGRLRGEALAPGAPREGAAQGGPPGDLLGGGEPAAAGEPPRPAQHHREGPPAPRARPT